jgi:hypothetical protein
MQMNAFTRAEAAMATDQFKESCGNLSIDTLLPKTCLQEPTDIQNPVRAYDSTEVAFESFINGAGI